MIVSSSGFSFKRLLSSSSKVSSSEGGVYRKRSLSINLGNYSCNFVLKL
jgi:hypothetical protein